MGERVVVYRSERHMFTVSEAEAGLLLEVLCGQSGVYLREHWLTDEERALFEEEPEALSALARSLCD